MPTPTRPHAAMDREVADAIALEGLAFLAQDRARMAQFLALSGLHGGQLRALLGTRELALAVLEHLAADESLLLVFSQSHAIPPQRIRPAILLLSAAEQ